MALLFGIVGIILGIIAIYLGKQDQQKGLAKADEGIKFGIVGVVLAVGLMMVSLVLGGLLFGLF